MERIEEQLNSRELGNAWGLRSRGRDNFLKETGIRVMKGIVSSLVMLVVGSGRCSIDGELLLKI